MSKLGRSRFDENRQMDVLTGRFCYALAIMGGGMPAITSIEMMKVLELAHR